MTVSFQLYWYLSVITITSAKLQRHQAILHLNSNPSFLGYQRTWTTWQLTKAPAFYLFFPHEKMKFSKEYPFGIFFCFEPSSSFQMINFVPLLDDADCFFFFFGGDDVDCWQLDTTLLAIPLHFAHNANKISYQCQDKNSKTIFLGR